MKTLFGILAYCIFATCVYSQEVADTVSVRVQYYALYKHTQEQKEAYDDINLLDIGRHSSRFYRRTRQTLWSAVQMLTQKLCCQTIHDCPKVVPLHYESE